MRIISILNQKGGVGKTSTAVSLSAALNRKKKKVLLIDFDPQGDSSDTTGLEEEQEVTTLEFLTQNKDARMKFDSYDLMPADASLASFDLTVASRISRESILKKNLQMFEGEYDYVILDCQPSLSLLPINALVASHNIIVPIRPGKYSAKGIKALLSTIEEIQPLNPNLDFKFLITQYNRSYSHHVDLKEKLEKSLGKLMMDIIIRQDVKMDKSQLDNKNIYEFDEKCKAAVDYEKLASEVLNFG